MVIFFDLNFFSSLFFLSSLFSLSPFFFSGKFKRLTKEGKFLDRHYFVFSDLMLCTELAGFLFFFSSFSFLFFFLFLFSFFFLLSFNIENYFFFNLSLIFKNKTKHPLLFLSPPHPLSPLSLFHKRKKIQSKRSFLFGRQSSWTMSTGRKNWNYDFSIFSRTSYYYFS